MKRTRPILLATDFSKASRPAFRYALRLAKETGAPLMIVHVFVPPFLGGGEIFPRVYEEVVAQMRSEATRNLTRLLREAKKSGVTATASLRHGVPHVEIARATRTRRAELIVIGTHGRTGPARLLLGSVASRVIGTARCPVLTVPYRFSR
jgi:nucleotide-binding universal stress UspA family protein